MRPMTDWIQSVASALLVLSADLKSIVAANATARSLLDLGEIDGRDPAASDLSLQNLFGVTGALAIARHFGDADAGGDPWLPLVVDVSGRTRRLVVACKPHSGRWVMSIEPREIVEALDLEAAVFRKVLDALPVGVDLFDKQYNCVLSNKYITETLGYYGVNTSPTFDMWFEHAYPDPIYRDKAQQTWANSVLAVRNGAEVSDQGDWWVRCEDGETRRLRFILMPLGRFNLQVTVDMTERYRSDSDLRRLAFFDELTGASTRVHFRAKSEEVTQAARLADRPVLLVLVDIDHFKSVNDRHGHAAGDTVLREVAARCRAVFGQDAVVGRLGGDEFVALAAAADARAAEDIAAAVVAAIAGMPVDVGASVVHVSASVGVFRGKARGYSLDEMLTIADEALYAAKRAGRDRFHIVDG